MKNEKLYVIIIGIMCFIIASSICVQYRSVQKYITVGEASVQSMAENKLRDQVLKEQEYLEELSDNAEELQEQLEELRKNAASNSDEAKVLEKELSELNRLIGYTDVTGKGLIITLEDSENNSNNYSSDSIIHDIDLVEIANELFNAGAEAVSINGQRIISTTAINCNGNVVKINNQKIAVPFVIKAIGSPEGLYGTMIRPAGYLDFMKAAGIKVKLEKKEKNNDISVPKYIGTKQYQYLQVVE